MNTENQFISSTVDTFETSKLTVDASKRSYHAPVLTVHGKLERVTQQTTSTPGGGSGGLDDET